MATISAAVGPGAPNHPSDLRVVQLLLQRHQQWLGGVRAPAADGIPTQATALAILGFQKDGAALAKPTGVVFPGDFTMSRLNLPHIPGPRHRIFSSFCWRLTDDSLGDADYVKAADLLKCEVAAIKAVTITEVKQAPFDRQNRPTILFERHLFSKHTHGVYNSTHPDICSPTAGSYGKPEQQYDRLRRAAMLDEAAALKSASWGMFQILGENFEPAGFANVYMFLDAMMKGRNQHLKGFVNLVAFPLNVSMKKAIQTRDWATFARLYNGRGYARNSYDTKMRNEYERMAGKIRVAPVRVR